MQISIVIPAYNGEKYLPFTVQSVQAQTVTDWELVIVDDGSKDRTNEIAQSLAAADARIRVVRQENGGLSAARNAGFKASDPTSKYIIFIDADDVWEPDALETLVGALEADPQAVAAHGIGRFIDAEGNLYQPGVMEARFRERFAVVNKKLVNWPLDRPTTFDCEVVSNYVATSGVILLRRADFTACGLFDTSLRSCEDWDMWLRLCRRGNLAFVNKVVLGYRQHGENMSKKSRTMAEAELMVRKKHLSWPEDTPERREMVRLGYRFRSKQICGYRLDWAKGCLRKGQVILAAQHLRHALLSYMLYRRGPSF